MIVVLAWAAAPAQAQTTTDNVGNLNAAQSCGAGMYLNRYEVTTARQLGQFIHWVFAPVQEPIDYVVYEATSAAGPYTLVWSGNGMTAATPLQISPPPNYNMTAGSWYLVGVNIGTGNNVGLTPLTCFGNPPATETVSFGTANESVDTGWSSVLPFTITPTTNAVLHRQQVVTIPPNFPPVADAGGPYTAFESNPTVLFDASGTTDPDGDLDLYDWRCNLAAGNGSCATTFHPVQTASYTYAANDDATYIVELFVTDQMSNSDTDVTTVTVLNEAPTVSASCDNGTCAGDEGDSLGFTCTGTDPGADPVILSWTWSDDGSTSSGGAASHVWSDDGAFTATCLGDDLDGGTDTEVLNVTLANVAPVLGPVTSTPSGDEGDSLAFTATATDAGSADVLTFTWDWGDGTTSVGASASHTYPDEGSFNTSVTVTDGDGGSDTSSAVVVTVANVAPVLTMSCPASAEEGSPLSIGATLVDPGADTWLWTLTGAPGAMTLTPAAGAASATVAWTPTFADIAAGTFDLTVTVDDQDGGTDSVACAGVPLTYIDVDGDSLPDTWESTNGVTDPTADPDGDGRTNLQEFTDGTDPNVYDGPDLPVPTSPIDGNDATSTTPALTWTDATSPVGDALTYDVEVFSDDAGTVLHTSTAGLAAGGGATTWTVDVALADNAGASWRVRASDAYVSGAWTAVQPFFVDVANEAPGAPDVVSPADEAIVGELTPLVLEVTSVADPEGDEFAYEIEVYDDVDLTNPAGTSSGDPQWDGFTAFVEDGRLWWRARTVDVEGAASAWGGPWTFLPSAQDDPPPAPVFDWPIDGGQSAVLAPVFELSGAADPEELPVTFEIELSTDEEFLGEVPSSGGLPEDAPGEVVWDSAPAGEVFGEDVVGWARARATDAGGTVTDWTTISFTPNVQNDPPTAPTLIAPTGGEDVGSETTLRVTGAVDPDGTVRRYEFEVSGTDTVVFTEVVDVAGDETTALIEENSLGTGEYSWTARALDDLDLAGPWAAPETFVFTAEGDDDDAADDDDATGDDDDSADDPVEGCEDCEASLGGGSGAGLFGLLVLGLRRRR